MSAIAGILDLKITTQAVERMLMSMARRGGKGTSSYISKGKAILHADASADTNSVEQPVILDHEKERYIISFDGFLYNKNELIQELEKAGHRPETDSDAEAVLRGYICWKEEVLHKINGGYAFAILSENREEVFFARDRLGIKPFFYSKLDNGLLFSSEMKSILSYPGKNAEIDATGAAEVLLLGPGRTPGSGVFKGILELEPGFYGSYRNGNLRLHRYWQLRDRVHTDDFDKTAAYIRQLLIDSVLSNMRAATPVGTLLSGGLDSSVVSAICAREMDALGQNLNTFSLDYENNDRYFVPGKFQPNSDTEYIRIMQEELDSHHHWTVLKSEDLIEGICDATIARDLPGMADIDSSLMAFCRDIKSHSGIVLSGECADEIFGGYPWYRDPEMRQIQGFPWANTTRERTAFMQPWLKEQIDPAEFISERYHQTITQSDILPENDPQERRIKELMNLNLRWFMQTLLDRGDRIGAYCAVEIRVPFCDYRIAEYMYGVPWRFKDYKGYEKGLLRHAMEGFIPQSVLYRKKSPFPKTYDPHYLDLVSQLLNGLLQDDRAPIYGLVRKEALKNLLDQDFTWPWYGQLMQRPQTIVYMLQLNYWLEHYSVNIV